MIEGKSRKSFSAIMTCHFVRDFCAAGASGMISSFFVGCEAMRLALSTGLTTAIAKYGHDVRSITGAPAYRFAYSGVQSQIAGNEDDHDNHTDNVKNVHFYTPIETRVASI
jgi:hypothetical protein